MFWKKNKRIMMDHASTTPLDSRVLDAMNHVMKNHYVNPHGWYHEGYNASHLIDTARHTVAQLLRTTREHIIFTRGGTESITLAISGIINKALPLFSETAPHIIVSEIEHSAVLETVRMWEQKKLITLSIIPVDVSGFVSLDAIKQALTPETILVSIMYANNEIGTIQPIKEIAKLIRWYKKHHASGSTYPLFHSDAIQAVNYCDIAVDRLGVDVLSLSASKMYGPKSAGIVYVKNTSLIEPLLFGGGQESGFRSGTEDIAQIVGFAKALEITESIKDQEIKRLTGLQHYFFDTLQKYIPDCIVNGYEPYPHDTEMKRLPNNVNISLPGISSERLVIELDAQGVLASSQSACRLESEEESYVIRAIRKNTENKQNSIEGSLRFSMGRTTTRSDITKTCEVLAKRVAKIRAFEKTLI